MGKKVVTLGEIMLRLSTPGNTRFVQSDSFDVVYGGGEANVAVSCANYGHDAYFVTKLPKHEIGQSAVNALRKYKNIASMSNFKTLKNFFYFNREIVYLIALGYLALIFVIIALSFIVREQNKTIIFLQNGIIRKQTTQYINKPRVKKLLENEYKMFTNTSHR